MKSKLIISALLTYLIISTSVFANTVAKTTLVHDNHNKLANITILKENMNHKDMKDDRRKIKAKHQKINFEHKDKKDEREYKLK